MHDGVMRMRRLQEGLEIKLGQTVELEPSGNQIRFAGLHERLKEGQVIKGTPIFEKAAIVEVEYHVVRRVGR
jgi:copper(I)-binding protein